MIFPTKKELNYYRNRVLMSNLIEEREEAEFLSVRKSNDDDVTDLCWNSKLLNARFLKEKDKTNG